MRTSNNRAKITVTGSREKYFIDSTIGYKGTVKILERYGENVVFGCGDSPLGGVDAWVKNYCLSNNIPIFLFPPKSFTREAFIRRNRDMVLWCDKLICIFAEGIRVKSGTFSTLMFALKMNKPIEVYIINSRERKIIQVIPKLMLRKGRLWIKGWSIVEEVEI